jgi:ovo
LGGDIPYGARSHILTQAQRKEYPHAYESIDKTEPNSNNVTLIDDPLPQSPKKLAINKTESQPPSKDKRPTPPPPPSSEMVVRCSVIQRTPAATATSAAERGGQEESDIKLPVSMLLNQQHVEPEQDQPIDYHIPKRKDSGRGDDEEDKGRKLREVGGNI